MKFNITVTRTDEYEIEIDETIWDEAALKEWSHVFHSVRNVKQVAEDFAIAFMRNENSYFIEGYGYVREYYNDGSLKTYYKSGEGMTEVSDEDYAKGMSIKPISQDDNYETEIN